MGLFGFFKSKKQPIEEMMEKISHSTFPNGEKDISAGAKELLTILNSKVDYNTAKSIFVKSVMISRISAKFDKDRLRNHLAGYCLQHFNESQVEKFHSYLTTFIVAMTIHGSTPSDVKREGDSYYW